MSLSRSLGSAALACSAALATTAGTAGAQAFNGGYFGTCSSAGGDIAGSNASCGVAGANGVVTTSGLAGSTQYGWISTRGGTTDNAVKLAGV